MLKGVLGGLYNLEHYSEEIGKIENWVSERVLSKDWRDVEVF